MKKPAVNKESSLKKKIQDGKVKKKAKKGVSEVYWKRILKHTAQSNNAKLILSEMGYKPIYRSNRLLDGSISTIVNVNGKVYTGVGPNKQAASTAAAQCALDNILISKINDNEISDDDQDDSIWCRALTYICKRYIELLDSFGYNNVPIPQSLVQSATMDVAQEEKDIIRMARSRYPDLHFIEVTEGEHPTVHFGYMVYVNEKPIKVIGDCRKKAKRALCKQLLSM